MSEGQTIQTERLVLRQPIPADEADYVAFMRSDRARHVGGSPDQKRAWYAFATEFGHWAIRGFGMWAVTQRGEDRALGFVGPWYPDTWPEHELGWLIYAEAEGKGVAYEAALAARTHAFRSLGWKTAVSYVDEDNFRSRKLAERLGATLDPAAAWPGQETGAEPCLVYRHPAPEGLQ